MDLKRILLVQVDSRALDSQDNPLKKGDASGGTDISMSAASYASLSSALNHHYCRHHGYDYLLVQPTIDVERVLAALQQGELTPGSSSSIGGNGISAQAGRAKALPGYDNATTDARQAIGTFHAGLRQFRSVSWAKLPTLLYLSLQLGKHYDLIWYVDSDMAISDRPTGRSIREKLEVIQNASKCLGPARTWPCINWGPHSVMDSPMLLFPNSPFGDTEPCAGTFMFRPALASSMLLEWWNVDMPEKNFGLMHEQDALWNLTSESRVSELRLRSPGERVSNASLSRQTVTLVQEFQFPQKNDKKQMCVDGKQWLCHLITTDHEYRAPWFREMLEKAGFTQPHFRAAIRHIKHSLSLKLDMLDAALLVHKHAQELRTNMLDSGSVRLDLLPKGLKLLPEERKFIMV